MSFEMKYTDKSQFILKLNDLHKAEEYALKDGRDLVFGISFGGYTYTVITEEYYERLNRALHQKD